jgi:hypothetical protein
MNVKLSEEDLALIVRALDHYYAYTHAVHRDDDRYQVLAERLTKPERAAPRREAHSRREIPPNALTLTLPCPATFPFLRERACHVASPTAEWFSDSPSSPVSPL